MGNFADNGEIFCKAIWLPLNSQRNYKKSMLEISRIKLMNSTMYKLSYNKYPNLTILDSFNLYKKYNVRENQYFRESTIYNLDN